MASGAALSVESREALAAVTASTAALAAFIGSGAELPSADAQPRDTDPFRGIDPLRDLADD
ncbi:hypothetical protein, partial [Arthrobacter sp. PsM3]|uniref:hypothetical protein n=1 Tax=Arthrobacter sp. PsM3 TaxID=3030531 RepID=UPI00263A4006